MARWSAIIDWAYDSGDNPEHIHVRDHCGRAQAGVQAWLLRTAVGGVREKWRVLISPFEELRLGYMWPEGSYFILVSLLRSLWGMRSC